jgi:hypothetical protein
LLASSSRCRSKSLRYSSKISQVEQEPVAIGSAQEGGQVSRRCWGGGGGAARVEQTVAGPPARAAGAAAPPPPQPWLNKQWPVSAALPRGRAECVVRVQSAAHYARGPTTSAGMYVREDERRWAVAGCPA